MKCHMAAHIRHPEALVQNFLQLIDISSWIGQNENTLSHPCASLDIEAISFTLFEHIVDCSSCLAEMIVDSVL